MDINPESRSLEQAILKTADSQGDRAALRKDLPFILGALKTDLIIVSRDDEARRLFHQAAKHVAQLRSITWTNPVTDEEIVAWLQGRATTPTRWRLGEEEPSSD